MSTEVFRDDDAGYRRWAAAHASGWVLNCYRNPTASYLKLHRADCWTVTGSPARGRRWTVDYIKVCSTDRGAIERWALSEAGGRPQPCSWCVK